MPTAVLGGSVSPCSGARQRMRFLHFQSVMKPRVPVIFAGLMLVMLLGALDATILATALPTIVSDLGGLERIGWVVTAYLLTQTVSTPLYGRLGDLYGRKPVLQVAIVVFLAGSALCGLAQSMVQLILFRAIQGLGGGGLIVTTQAVVADIVTPRERGKYQGLLGAGFGIASIAGPLLGGFFTSELSWRWIFYINVPFGIAALAVLSASLPARSGEAGEAIDYTGAGLLAIVLSGLVLLTEAGGEVVGWQIIAALAVIVAAGVALIVVERRARTPILPLHLFADRTFTLCTTVGLSVGFALFGSVAYMPMFLQTAQGSSPTASGLEMMPMMGGALAASIFSGQMISRTGRYKLFPVVGTALVVVALVMLSRLTVDITKPALMAQLLLLGVGLGLVMQVLIVAVQNAVPYRDLGAATSSAMLFRLVGGSVGTALLGVVFASTFASGSAATDPAAMTQAMHRVFTVAAAVAAAGAILTWFIPERPLRDTIAASASDVGRDAGEAFALQAGGGSEDALARGLSILADRDVRRAYIQAIAQRAGVDLMPISAWLMIRLGENEHSDLHALAAQQGITRERVEEGLAELHARRLVTRTDGANRVLTAEGCEVFGKLNKARRARLSELAAQWPQEQREEIALVLRSLANALVPERRADGS